MTYQKILAEAAEVMSERGHHKGGYENPQTGAVCAAGAINVVVTGQPKALPQDTAVQALENLAKSLGLTHEFSLVQAIPEWNDAEETTGEEVILALKRASELET